ncbi:hypothetical protein TW81_02260 [Vibrio galatheae]|uniref:Uncharacterized protein n=1 Tax=Vibrio galatheae TaxID=579748 RepID=A0A0F4NPS0_9VIBR|nr:hypothetical protein [Vibrio galatheae]KJY84838.1 hypothetical protein TW81_02260 [Vibrio galatheae]
MQGLLQPSAGPTAGPAPAQPDTRKADLEQLVSLLLGIVYKDALPQVLEAAKSEQAPQKLSEVLAMATMAVVQQAAQAGKELAPEVIIKALMEASTSLADFLIEVGGANKEDGKIIARVLMFNAGNKIAQQLPPQFGELLNQMKQQAGAQQ